MDRLNTKEQKSPDLPYGRTRMTDRALPVLASLLLHLGIVAAALLLVQSPQESVRSTGRIQPQRPVFITFIQESDIQRAVPEVIRPEKNVKSDTGRLDPENAQSEFPIEKAPAKMAVPPRSDTLQKEKREQISPEEKKRKTLKNIQRVQSIEAGGSADSRTSPYQGGAGDAELRYQDQVRAAILSQKFYPRQARRLKMQGEVIVQLAVMRDGKIGSSHFIKSAGYPVLDEAAQVMISAAAPFPAVPDTIRDIPLKLIIPIYFQSEAGN
jgi:protein TonB